MSILSAAKITTISGKIVIILAALMAVLVAIWPCEVLQRDALSPDTAQAEE